MGLVRRGVHLSCYDGPADDRIILECLNIDIDTVMNSIFGESTYWHYKKVLLCTYLAKILKNYSSKKGIGGTSRC